ncbi:hypothetical protein L596_007155 [Steinernema carpocapsae]|uniref:Uncharacterized protein n=1 Tax=Steinernema carpocapsae TaxID=34508 RepID=A0A4U5P8D7_STECR|nr:hypothetical protein L596_007155 [Steinernema carpocapsae]
MAEPRVLGNENVIELEAESSADEEIGEEEGIDSEHDEDEESFSTEDHASSPASSSSESGSVDESVTTSDSERSDCLSDVWNDEGDRSKQFVLSTEAEEEGLREEYNEVVQNSYPDDQAFRKFLKLLANPILTKFRMEDLEQYDWKEAVERSAHVMVSKNGQLYYHINKNIGNICARHSLPEYALPYYLQALSINPNDREVWWEVALVATKNAQWNFAEFAVSMSPKHIRTRKLLAVIHFCSFQYENCLEDILVLLQEDARTDQNAKKLAVVLKDEIAKKSKYHKEMVEDVLARKRLELVNVSEAERSSLFDHVKLLVKPQNTTPAKLAIPYRYVEVEISQKMKIENFGVLLCDLYDRTEAFSNLSFQKIRFKVSAEEIAEQERKRAQDRPYDNIPVEVVDCLTDILDCVCCTEDLVLGVVGGKVKSPKPVKKAKSKPKLKRRGSALALFQRRSTRYIEHDEASTDDESVPDDKLLELLDLSEDICEERVSKYELRLRKIAKDKPEKALECSVLENSACEDFLALFCTDLEQEYLIEDLLKRYIEFLTSAHYDLSGYLHTVFDGAYTRWMLFQNKNNTVEAKKSLNIHLAAAELDCDMAIRFCAKVLLIEGEHDCEDLARFYWILGNDLVLDTELKTTHLDKVEAIMTHLAEEKDDAVFSFMPEKHTISAEAAVDEKFEIKRREQLEKLDELVSGSRNEEIVLLLESHYDWNHTEEEDLLKTAFILLDCYAKTGRMDKFTEWTLRIIRAFLNESLTDEKRVLELLTFLKIDSTLGNELIQDFGYYLYLLRDSNLVSQSPVYWMRLYEVSKILEGGITLDVVNRNVERTADGDFEDYMPTRALGVLQMAHEKLGANRCCSKDKGDFLVYFLNELNQIVADTSIRDVLFSRSAKQNFHDIALTFGEEVNQILFCLFTKNSKRTKNAYDDHHSECDLAPTWREAEVLIPILFREKLHLFDDKLKIPVESIDIIIKRFAFIWKKDFGKTEENFDAFLDRGIVGEWPRLPVDEKKKDRIRCTIFYALALYYYQGTNPKEAHHYSKRFLMCASRGEPAWTASAWAIYAHSNSTQVLSESDDILLGSVKKCMFAFDMGLSVKDDVAIMHFEYANTLYQFRSRISRYAATLERSRKRGMAHAMLPELLQNCRKHIQLADELNNVESEPELDIEWLACYFQGKLAEKLDEPAEQVLHWYYQCAKVLERQGYQYTQKIAKKKQDNLEPVELHYRVYAYIWKRLINFDELPELRDMNVLAVYAEHFENHGVTRKYLASPGADERFDREPAIGISQVIDTSSQTRPEDAEILGITAEMVERVHLREKCLALCEANFALVASRCPFHCKAHFRIAQMESQQGHYKRAVSHLFQKLFKKKNLFTSVFEQCIPIHRNDVERSGSFEFHLNRLLDLATLCCFKTNDLEKLCCLLYTLGLAAFTPGVLIETKRISGIHCLRKMLSTLVMRNEGNVLKLTSREKDTFLKTANSFLDKSKTYCDELTQKSFKHVVKLINEVTQKHREQNAIRARQVAAFRRPQVPQLPVPQVQNQPTINDANLLLLSNLLGIQQVQQQVNPLQQQVNSLQQQVNPLQQQLNLQQLFSAVGSSNLNSFANLLKRASSSSDGASSSGAPPSKISRK